MSKIDTKLEKIMVNTPKGIEEFGCPCTTCTKCRTKIIAKIKHLILSEIKKVEPKKMPKQGFFVGDTYAKGGFNQAISEYHKALEELLK
jgi:hypothetical protein